MAVLKYIKKMFMPQLSSKVLNALAALMLLGALGCQDRSNQPRSHGHSHDAPNGGTAVPLGDRLQLELITDTNSGSMMAAVYDSHFHGFVLVQETNFVLEAKFEGKTEQLNFQRTADPNLGAVPARSALFDTKSEWLKTVKSFEGKFPLIQLGGITFSNIVFPYPEGIKLVH